MYLLLKQKIKNLYSAEFEILEGNKIVGNFLLKGTPVSMETYLSGNIYDKNFSFNYINTSATKYKLYDILEENNKVGQIYQTKSKGNIFSKYDYVKCFYKNKEYNSYGIGIGKKAVSCVYKNNIQVAQIEKDGLVYNDLHNFDIYTNNIEDLYIALLISCYLYINSCYKPGVQVKKSYSKTYSKTTNKHLLEKYNPDWMKFIKR